MGRGQDLARVKTETGRQRKKEELEGEKLGRGGGGKILIGKNNYYKLADVKEDEWTRRI